MLKPQHQIDQLLFAELLQISPVHPRMDSEIRPRACAILASPELPEKKPDQNRSRN